MNANEKAATPQHQFIPIDGILSVVIMLRQPIVRTRKIKPGHRVGFPERCIQIPILAQILTFTNK